jgi:hypothetical protein
MMSCSPAITYLTEGGSRDLSVSFPLFELCGQDIIPEKLEELVFFHWLGESRARAEYCLYNTGNQSLPVSHDWVQEPTITPADLNCVCISDREGTLGSRPQANLSMGWTYVLDLGK